jgi:geranylgeranyl diphosphate synthase, type II
MTADILDRHAERIEEALAGRLPAESRPPETLHRAMRYTALAPGKRVRPVLTLVCGGMFSAPPDALLGAACAIEMVHASSLILDDLPCMDDASLRRGRETSHRLFGESTSILAAVGLLNLAFGTLAGLEEAGAPAEAAAETIAVLADAIGSSGIMAGQFVDLAVGRTPIDVTTLEYIHAHKTGSLFIASAEIGAVIGGAGRRERAALKRFSKNVGLAFQIVDDLLDARGDSGTIGKDVRKDAGRTTFATLCGVDGSRQLADELLGHALDALAPFGRRAEALRALVQRIRDRES